MATTSPWRAHGSTPILALDPVIGAVAGTPLPSVNMKGAYGLLVLAAGFPLATQALSTTTTTTRQRK
ncbi:MAG: hypothetical protein ACI8PT_003042 [Gammaproteobacteria bacterium]|jgi:hypothetical protein